MLSKDIVVILGHEDERVCAWTVYVGPNSDLGFSRLTGAWVLSPAEVLSLHFWPRVYGVICSEDSLEDIVQHLEVPVPRLSPDLLIDAMQNEMISLDKLYQGETERLRFEKKNSKLVAPRWPRLTRLFVPSLNGGEPFATKGNVIEAAWWVKSLCDTWSEIEEIRLARVYMRKLTGDVVRAQPWMNEVVLDTLF